MQRDLRSAFWHRFILVRCLGCLKFPASPSQLTYCHHWSRTGWHLVGHENNCGPSRLQWQRPRKLTSSWVKMIKGYCPPSSVPTGWSWCCLLLVWHRKALARSFFVCQELHWIVPVKVQFWEPGLGVAAHLIKFVITRCHPPGPKCLCSSQTDEFNGNPKGIITPAISPICAGSTDCCFMCCRSGFLFCSGGRCRFMLATRSFTWPWPFQLP